MKCTIPEISWHNKDPVLSIDLQICKEGEQFFRLASGGSDSHILIWHVIEQDSGIPILECAADLTRHQKAVNVVRFSPSGEFLASGDDESVIIIWKQKTDCDPIQFPSDGEENKEQWLVVKTLRGHLEDVYDLSWSPDGANLISGSVDNTALVWDVKKGHMLYILRDHKSFVQGVAWDPVGQYVATNCSDRTCRVFSTVSRKLISRTSKAILPNSDPEAKPVHLFHDDTLKSFFRRLSFTPCGSLLIVPSGVIEEPKLINTTVVFTRNNLSKPVAYLPSNNQHSVAVRCCPQLFSLRKSEEPPVFSLPYRVVFAVATQSDVTLYDTQHLAPIAYVANIHYTRLTDLTWSNDGRLLVVSSSDGYCSLISFAEGELGEKYKSSDQNTNLEIGTNKTGEMIDPPTENKLKITNDPPLNSDLNCQAQKKDKLNANSNSCGSNKISAEREEDDGEDFCLILEDTVNNVLDTGKTVETKKIVETSDMNGSEGSVSERINYESSLHEASKLKSGISHVISSKNSEEDTEGCSELMEVDWTPAKTISLCESPSNSNNSALKITPIEQRKPKRAQLITLSSPKSKRKL